MPSSSSPLPVSRPYDAGFGVYVHWPFCEAKCPYCDFNSHVRHGGVDEDRFLAAYLNELDHMRALTGPREAQSVFFGGGTPSRMAPKTAHAILERIARNWGFAAGAETTIEANPTSVEAGRFLVYGEHAVEDLTPGRIGVWIEAGPAFGTGHHATTKGCLEAVDALAGAGFSPQTVLDLGTGTGVLAIAAAKLWPDAEILAADIDEQSIAETVENAAKNGVKHRLEALVADGFHHPLFDGARFDLIFANILAGPLVELAPGLVERLAPQGRTILSGLLEEQTDRVRAAYVDQRLALEKRTILDGWATLTMVRS